MHISTEDRKLLNGCLDNDRHYQESLYRKYFKVAWNQCRRYTQDEDTLITIVNDAFLTIFKKAHLYKETGSFEGWMRRIFFNSLSDYFKKDNRRQKFIEINHFDKTTNEVGPLSNLYLADLNQIIEELPTNTRDVFILYAIEGYNHREIAEQLHIAEGTSKWHLSQARTLLKQKLSSSKGIQYG